MSEEYVLELTIPEIAGPASTCSAGGEDRSFKTIVGYCWPWTARPGETVDFKVSTLAQGDYEAQLTRVICGDSMSAAGLYKEDTVPAGFAGRHPGRHQPTYPGSFVLIPARPVLDRLRSFTVQAMLLPTCLPGPFDQHLVSRWDPQRQLGWALLIDERGRVVFRMGCNAGIHDTTIDRPLSEHQWYLAVASVGTESRRVSIFLECHSKTPTAVVAEPRMSNETSYPPDFMPIQTGPLCFAGCTNSVDAESAPKPSFCFNGRLDRVRLSSGALGFATARALCKPELPTAYPHVVGFWDFAADIDGVDVRDRSSNGLHGRIVNAPTRAVTGVDWDGSTHDWRIMPQHYSAIHFHDDDLYDAQWQTDFQFRVPEDLPSGVYAARLCQGRSEDYVPFFVAPPKGKTQARIALLLPTATYTAYTNVASLLVGRSKTLRKAANGKLQITEEGLCENTIQRNPAHVDFLLEHVREYGAGFYALHTDGSLWTQASQKHPNLSTKPKGMNWTLVADTYLIDWLEQKNIKCDVLTDDLLHQEGVDLLKPYRVVMTGNHPEYYSQSMLDAVSAYHELGGRWMYLGGNGFYWVTSFHSQLPGLVEVRKYPYIPAFERRHAFDGVNGGMWRDNGRPPQKLMGVGYCADTLNSSCAYQRLPESYDPRATFIFEGIDAEIIGDFGLIGGGAAGQEVDRVSENLGTPAHALHLARAERLCRSRVDETELVAPTADIVFFEGPRGGAVFSVGSMAWLGALSHNAYDNDVSRITENVLRRFMDEAPFTSPMSTKVHLLAVGR